MKTVIALSASVLINASLVIAFERSATQAMPLPNGEVIVTELGPDVAAVTLARTTFGAGAELQSL